MSLAAEKGRLLVVGLGNPGERYRMTRHNLGFLVVERIAAEWKVSWRDRAFAAETEWFSPADCAGVRLKLAKPLTYMNRSGLAVARLVEQEGIIPEQLLVVCDDVNLPFGKLRIRLKGSDGGHNGLASIIEALGTEEFPRLRVGIGSNFEPGGMVDYVLSEFEREEQEKLPEVLERAARAVRAFACEGPERAMTEFNR